MRIIIGSTADQADQGVAMVFNDDGEPIGLIHDLATLALFIAELPESGGAVQACDGKLVIELHEFLEAEFEEITDREPPA